MGKSTLEEEIENVKLNIYFFTLMDVNILLITSTLKASSCRQLKFSCVQEFEDDYFQHYILSQIQFLISYTTQIPKPS